MKYGRITIYFLLSAVLLSGGLSPQYTAAAEEEARESRIIVSLGDSYSSGEGIEPFFCQEKDDLTKEYEQDWLAHRSQRAWSGMLRLPAVSGTMADHWKKNWYFAASSGATTENMLASQSKPVNRYSEHTEYISPQLSIFDQLEAEGKKADYVTVTIGGNDVEFAQIIETAAKSLSYLCPNNLLGHVNTVWMRFYALGGIKDSIKNAYQLIARKAGDQATIIVAGYPRLLAEYGSLLLFDSQESMYIDAQVTQFNRELSQLVGKCREEGLNIEFVPVEEAFSGHEAYSPLPCIHGVILLLPKLGLTEDLDQSEMVSSYSMHPNYAGACIYAKCVQEKIDELEARKRGPAEAPDSSGETERVSDLNAGDTVLFGRYEQDNNPDNGPEPIEWMVLAADGDQGRALLVSRYALDAHQYHRRLEDTSWEDCTLRTWLNDEFFNTAFNGDEQSAVPVTDVDNGPGQGATLWGTVDGGNSTRDRVFLLSYHEVFDQYFSTETQRICTPTKYAVAQGALEMPFVGLTDLSTSYAALIGALSPDIIRQPAGESGRVTSLWWLRTPGPQKNMAFIVNIDGSGFSSFAYNVDCIDVSVRPALWVDYRSGADIRYADR